MSAYQANIIICPKREWHNQTLRSFYQICATSHILSIDEAWYFYAFQETETINNNKFWKEDGHIILSFFVHFQRKCTKLLKEIGGLKRP